MPSASPQIFTYEIIDSTMDEARRLVNAGKIKDFGVVIANHQTKGRGTRGRKWDSPKDAGVYLSIIFIPEDKDLFNATTFYTQKAGYACIEAIKEVTGIECKLKLVNDIYFNGKKLGGILTESVLKKDKISLLITGIGINIEKTDYMLDRNIVSPVSLEEIMSEKDFKVFDKKELIEAIVKRFTANMRKFLV